MEKSASKETRKSKNAERNPKEGPQNGASSSSEPRAGPGRKDKDQVKVDFLKNQFKELREALHDFWPREIDDTVEAAIKLMTTQSQRLAQAEYASSQLKGLVQNLKEISQEQQMRLEVHSKIQKDGQMRMLKSACRFHAMIREYTEAHHFISEKEFRYLEERAREHGEAPCPSTNDCKGPKNSEGVCRSKAWYQAQIDFERECLRSAARVYRDQEKEMAAEKRQLEDEVDILKEKLSSEQFRDLTELEDEFDDVCQRLLRGRFERRGIKLTSKSNQKRSSAGSPQSKLPRFPPPREADSDSDSDVEIIKPPTEFKVIIPKGRHNITYDADKCLPGTSKDEDQKKAEEIEFVNRIATQTARNAARRAADGKDKSIKTSTVKKAIEKYKARTQAAVREASQQMNALVNGLDEPRSASRSAREQVLCDTDTETEDEFIQSVSIDTDEVDESQEESVVEDVEENGKKRKRKQNTNNGKNAAKRSKAGN